MTQASNMVTSRLPQDLVERLNHAARNTRRSRSWIIREALETYLSASPCQPADLMSYAGAGVKLSERRTPEEVEAEIRWLRDGDG